MDSATLLSLKNTFEVIIERLSVDLPANHEGTETRIVNLEIPHSQESALTAFSSSVLAKINSRNHLLISDLQSALKRIEKGSYGICKKCWREIDVNELRIQPMIELCSKCGSTMT